MDVHFLPQSIRQLNLRNPLCVIRTNGGEEREYSEGYLVLLEDRLYLFSKKFSETEFKSFEFLPTIKEQIQIEISDFFVSMKFPGESVYCIKVSKYDYSLFSSFFQKWGEPNSKKDHSCSPVNQNKILKWNHRQKLVAILMFKLGAQNPEFNMETYRYIQWYFFYDDSFLSECKSAVENYELLSLLKEIKAVCNHEQCLCILANLIELAMTDFYFRGKEQRMIQHVASIFEIEQKDIDQILYVLNVKNQRSYLDD